METYIKSNGESAYEIGLAAPEQMLVIGQEGTSSFDQLSSLVDFSKLHGIDLSSYGLSAFTSNLPAHNNYSNQIHLSNSNSSGTVSPTSIATSSSPLTYVQPPIQPPAMSNALIQSPSSSSNQGGDYFDVTPYITLSQEKAAKRLGIPKSTLSKRWREATCNRKWPYRQLCKLDREIKTLVHNMHSHAGSIEPQLQSNLASLMRQRQEESRVVFIKNVPTTTTKLEIPLLNL